MEYIIRNGRRYYLSKHGNGALAYGWEDDFANHANLGGNHGWRSADDAILAAKQAGYSVNIAAASAVA